MSEKRRLRLVICKKAALHLTYSGAGDAWRRPYNANPVRQINRV